MPLYPSITVKNPKSQLNPAEPKLTFSLELVNNSSQLIAIHRNVKPVQTKYPMTKYPMTIEPIAKL